MKNTFSFSFWFSLFTLLHAVFAKECTNIPTIDSISTASNQVYNTSGPTFDFNSLYSKIKNSKNVNESSNFLREVSLHDVRLDPDSIHGTAQQTNLEYILMLDVDSLVWNFRRTANLPTVGEPYLGWENYTSELRGHFVGHYLTATAQMWASTKNRSVYDKMNAVVNALDECQKKIGTGYLSGFPSVEFDRFEAVQPIWAPYYTLHKIMSGLLDQFTLAGNAQALNMVVWLADYFTERVMNVISRFSLERHYLSLNNESGGMNEVFYRLYSITGNPKNLAVGTLFDKPCFLGMLAMQADTLSNFHANTHLAILVGTQKRYEVTGEPLYKAINTFFMDIVNSSHAYATGGTSNNEHWTDPRRLGTTLHTENQETCSTYNMLKISRHLFRWTKQMEYADYYERTLTNSILSVQRGREPGVMIYMTPLGRGSSKARSYHGWGTKFKSFWCCYGTGIESFSKLGDSIYFEEGDPLGLYIVQYISSSFDWKVGGMMINQKVKPVSSMDRVFSVEFNFTTTTDAGKAIPLHFRMPHWADAVGARAKLNNDDLPLPPLGNFLTVNRTWCSGDTLSLEFPMKIWTEPIKDDRAEFAFVQAIFYGPYLLAGLSTGDWDLSTGGKSTTEDWIAPIPASLYNSQLVTLYQQSDKNETFAFTNSNSTFTMEKMSAPGNESAVWATFRVISKDEENRSGSSSERDFIGKSVMLEPLDLPGTRLVLNQSQAQGLNRSLLLANVDADFPISSAMFRIVEGLDKNDTVSLESEDQKGCYLYSGVNYIAGTSVQVVCQSGNNDINFPRAASFKLTKGLTEFHPVSFVAKGPTRNYVLMPLLSLRDETYTVYFNMPLDNTV